jgi:precorrin-8X/cobalt-precorrin-8 methylmutase
LIFDRYIMVDWSASNRPRAGKDSVWICVHGADGSMSTKNPPTRGQAETIVRNVLHRSVADGERVLVGFDFPYGYPGGLAAALGLTGPPWLAIWQYLVTTVRDERNSNKNNRFQVAADLNAQLGVHAFWGRPPTQPLTDLSALRDLVVYRSDAADSGLAEWREVEAILRARRQQPQPAWKLFGNGAVGSQTLTGIPVVARLRYDDTLAGVSAVWPFEVSVSELPAQRAAVIHAEIWPSLIDIPSVTGQVKDQTQVIYLASEYRERDLAGTLAEAFAAAPKDAALEEGWILGVE